MNDAMKSAFRVSAQPIFSLLKEEKFIEAQNLINQGGFDVNETNENESSLLFVALLNKQYAMAQSLIQIGSDINHKNYRGQFPLSAQAGSIKGLKRNLQVFEKCAVKPDMTLENLQALVELHTYRNSPQNQINHLKLIFDYFADTIATFNPVNIQEILAQSTNRQALDWYQNTYINKGLSNNTDLALRKDFQFLKHMIDKSEDYFNYYSYCREEDTVEYQNKISQLKTWANEIRNAVNHIHNAEEFKYFFYFEMTPEIKDNNDNANTIKKLRFQDLCEKMLSVIYPDIQVDETNLNSVLYAYKHEHYLTHPVVEMLNVAKAVLNYSTQQPVNPGSDNLNDGNDNGNNSSSENDNKKPELSAIDFTNHCLKSWVDDYFTNDNNITSKVNLRKTSRFSADFFAPEDKFLIESYLKPVLETYGLKSILLTRDQDFNQGVDSLKESLEEVLNLFPMSPEMVGNNELNVVIHHTSLGFDSSRPTNGLYENTTHHLSVNASQIKRKRIQTFLHEFTHYMQGRPFNNYDEYHEFFKEHTEDMDHLMLDQNDVFEKIIDNNLLNSSNTLNNQVVFSQYSHELQSQWPLQNNDIMSESMSSQFEKAIKSYEPFPVSDMSRYFSRYIVCSFGEEHEAIIQTLNEAILPVLQGLNRKTNLGELKEQLNKVIVPVLCEHFNASNMKSDNFVYQYLDSYVEFTKQKQFSFDYFFWSKLDKASNSVYWTQTVEIHARMNEALALNKIGVEHNLISPVKFEKIKAMIESFNLCLVEKAMALKENSKSNMNTSLLH